jgi:hypothetical protein
MAVLTVPFGYASKRVAIDQLDAYTTWSKLHPEFKARVLAMFVASDGHVGIGCGWRSSDVQLGMFLERHVVSPGGKIFYDGRTWALKKGCAPAAPPGLSFHEGVNNGLAMAVDIVGDSGWADDHAEQFGLIHFKSVNGEPWHFQCSELPHGVTAWIKQGRPQPKARSGSSPAISQPAKPAAPPAASAKRPILRLGDKGADVAAMQALLINAGTIADKPANHDGIFGPGVLKALERFQASHGLAADGLCGPRTWQALGG